MSLNDLKEQLSDQAKDLAEKITSSSLFNQLKEKYDLLDTKVQKVIIYSCITMLILMLINIPLSYYESANSFLERFSDRRVIMSDLLNIQVELDNAPKAPSYMTPDSLKIRVEQKLSELALNQEQIVAVDSIEGDESENSQIIPSSVMAGGVIVQLSKINLDQILNIGVIMQNLARHLKLLDLNISAHPEDPHYYNASFKLINFKLLVETSDSLIDESDSSDTNPRNKKRARGDE